MCGGGKTGAPSRCAEDWTGRRASGREREFCDLVVEILGPSASSGGGNAASSHSPALADGPVVARFGTDDGLGAASGRSASVGKVDPREDLMDIDDWIERLVRGW